jgi:uncharacterized OB-fold protein
MTMDAYRYEDGTISYPGHPRSRDGAEPVETIDLSEYTGEVITWTTSTATPPGVRAPNTLAIVEFDVDGETVRALGGTTTDDVEIGQTVTPVHVEELREAGVGIKPADGPQEWDGYRFEPV